MNTTQEPEEQVPDEAVAAEASPPVEEADQAERERIRAGVVDALCSVYDPEIPVNVYELGLIYGVEVSAARHVHIEMTLTSPNCPAVQTMPMEIEYKAAAVPGASGAEVELVWEPMWTPDLMSEAAKLELNML